MLYPSERAAQLGIPGRGIFTVNTDPKPTAHTYSVLDSAVLDADAVLEDLAADAGVLRAALASLRDALIPA